jgi:hypothetical protein
MARAAVLIGVNRTGKLPKLADAVEGASGLLVNYLNQLCLRMSYLSLVQGANHESRNADQSDR